MARTDASSVQGVLLGAYDGSSSLTPFIDTASLVIDRVAACGVRKGAPYSAAELELFERWLAAHYYAMSDQVEKSTRTLSSAAEFGGELGQGLDATKYGQTAKGLDPLGCLAAAAGGGRRTASLSWAGKPALEELSYEDRGN